MVLVAQPRLYQVGDHRGATTQLGMAEGVPGAGVGEKPAIRPFHSLGNHDRAIAVPLDRLFDARQERLLVEGNLGKQNDLRRLVMGTPGEPAGGGDPARVTPHHFHHEHFGGGFRHRFHIQAGLHHRHRHIFGHRAETRAVIGDRQIVVDGLGNAHADDRIAQFVADLGNLVGGIGGIAAAVIKEIADIVGRQYLDQAFVFDPVFLQALELVTTGSKSAAGRMLQRRDRLAAFRPGVDQLFPQGAQNAVFGGKYGAHAVWIGARGLDQAAGGGIDDRGHSAGL